MLTEDAVQIAPRELLEEATIEKRCKDERMSTLDHIDLSLKLTRAQEAKRLSKAQARLLYLRLVLGGIFDGSGRLGPPVCLVFEGWDASGKGGAIKRVMAPLDPRHVRVATFAAPTFDEKRHHFLTRFWDKLPGWGGMTILDRSWYGRVLVERIEGFCAEADWLRAYAEINDFEHELVEAGAIVLKFWLQIDDKEQLKRFQEREKIEHKQFKITAEDWRNREKWDAYQQAAVDMIDRTSTGQAPWIPVEANDKNFARVKILKAICERLEACL